MCIFLIVFFSYINISPIFVAIVASRFYNFTIYNNSEIQLKL